MTNYVRGAYLALALAGGGMAGISFICIMLNMITPKAGVDTSILVASCLISLCGGCYGYVKAVRVTATGAEEAA